MRSLAEEAVEHAGGGLHAIAGATRPACLPTSEQTAREGIAQVADADAPPCFITQGRAADG